MIKNNIVHPTVLYEASFLLIALVCQADCQLFVISNASVEPKIHSLMIKDNIVICYSTVLYEIGRLLIVLFKATF